MTNEQPIFRVPLPDWAKLSGRLLRGHQMGPLKDGWLMLYEHTEQPPDESLIDELCIVHTHDNRNLVRYVRKGAKPKCWDLVTVTGPAELDVRLQWAAKVVAIIPFKPTDEQVAASIALME